MSDLIRRMDAVQACQVGPSDEWSRSTKSGYNQAATDCAMNILRVPAVQPDARIKEYEEALECNEQFSVDNQILKKRVEKAEAERDRLREALNQSRLAFAGLVSVQSAIDLLDSAALDPNRLRDGVQP